MTYDPNIGRWLEEDPEGFDAGDMNLYRVEGNSPTDTVDPSGLKVVKVVNVRAGLHGYEPNSFYAYVPDNEKNPLKYVLDSVRPLIYSISGHERIVPLSAEENELVKVAGPNPKDQQYAANILNIISEPVYQGLIQFVSAGKRNKINNSVMEAIIRNSEFSVFPFWVNRCKAWTDTFAEKLIAGFKNPDFWPLKGTGLQGGTATWNINAFFGLTNSHVSYQILFPDNSKFFFDNKALSGHRITQPKDVPSEFTPGGGQ